jgi:hypothetical protein
LLLPDLSETHEIAVGVAQAMALDGVPSEAQLAGIVDAIAAFHAYWWEHPALGDAALPLSDLHGNRTTFDAYVAEIAANWAAFIGAERESFPAELRSLYEAALPRLAGLWERYLAGRVPERRNVTVGHGDCYFAAFLCPREANGQTYIIDWQGPSVDLAARDLDFLFANFWTREQRREGDREVRLLRRYHDGLLAHGVRGYGWGELVEDYRLMLIFRIFLPVWDMTNGSPQRYWWPKICCLTDAYRDWRCEELL